MASQLSASTLPTTRDEVEAVLKAKIDAGEAETGLYDTGAWYVVVDRVEDKFVFNWFERAIYLSEVLQA